MRSKTLLVSNILSSIYSVVLSWALIGITIIDAGGESIINTVGGFFESAFELINMELAIINYLYMLAITIVAHICLFIVGCIISWIAYVMKKDSIITVAAIIYLIVTICSPICLVFGIPVSVLTFLGASNQRKLNKTSEI